MYYKHSVYNISVDQVNQLSNKFSEIIYVTSIDNKEKLKIIGLNYPKFNKGIKYIFFKSTPYPENKYKPLKCLIQQIDCSIDKDKDYKKRSLDSLFNEIENFKIRNDKIFLFDSYNILCPEKKCVLYDKNKDLLFYRDATHLAVEGSATIAPKFNEFIQILQNK